jgi:hypothetical protein
MCVIATWRQFQRWGHPRLSKGYEYDEDSLGWTLVQPLGTLDNNRQEPKRWVQSTTATLSRGTMFAETAKTTTKDIN